jgi:alpha-L-fucosidase
MLTRRELVGMAACVPAFAAKTYGAKPSKRQLAWHARPLAAFLHFGINTFTDKEWGFGDEDPALFDPTQFDADSIVAALKASGMQKVILTCKHHDGLCLWPTNTTKHRARGDVVKEISAAARRAGLTFGVYLSPWDRNSAAYGSAEYLRIYRAQLHELLTHYGPIHEVWFDGANGGDGYYGGAREKRTIDRRTYYDWPRTWEIVRKLQPGAVIFSDVGPDVRWVGNERGEAGETCWATYDPVAPDGGVAAPGLVRERESTIGTRGGSKWMPPECDVSIRPGWFWHERENSRVKTPRQLIDLYYKSVGRGANLLLNVPPDRRGLIDDVDAASLREFGSALSATFDRPMATSKDMQLAPRGSFNVIRLREDIKDGQRVDGFEIHAAGKVIASGTSIGACKLIRLASPIETAELRVRVTELSFAPQWAEFSVFREAP